MKTKEQIEQKIAELRDSELYALERDRIVLAYECCAMREILNWVLQGEKQ